MGKPAIACVFLACPTPRLSYVQGHVSPPNEHKRESTEATPFSSRLIVSVLTVLVQVAFLVDKREKKEVAKDPHSRGAKKTHLLHPQLRPPTAHGSHRAQDSRNATFEAHSYLWGSPRPCPLSVLPFLSIFIFFASVLSLVPFKFRLFMTSLFFFFSNQPRCNVD